MSKNKSGKNYPRDLKEQSRINRIKLQSSSPTEESKFFQNENSYYPQNSTNTHNVSASKVSSEKSWSTIANEHLTLIGAIIVTLGALVTFIWWLLTMRYDIDSLKESIDEYSITIKSHEKSIQEHENMNSQNKIIIQYANEKIKRHDEEIKYINETLIKNNK